MNAPMQLRCEYLTNPLGIDATRPRLSWQSDDPRRGAKQSTYHILVASSLDALSQDGGDLWDSGHVASDQSIHIAYDGKSLASRQRCFWKVRTQDASHIQSPWSEAACFEMGLLDRVQWKAQWIGSHELGGPYTPAPSPYLRKTFSLDRPIKTARLYVTALGIYEFHVNGQLVSDGLFLPGRTEYFKRVQYQVFDLAPSLRSGDNAIGAILGDGWYCGHLHSDPRQYYGDRPRLLAQLMLDFADGASQTITTDASWKVTSNGPIRSSDILMGEDYDARLELPGWNTTSFDDSAWSTATIFPDPGIQLVATKSSPVRRTGEITPIAPPAISANKRRWIFDLGQNMVGYVRLKTPAPIKKSGATIDLRHAEMLDKDGKPYTTALRTARATDHYTLKGTADESAREVYEPKFTWHGFRYVEVRDVPGQPEQGTVTGIVVHSDLPVTGHFECSDKLINQLQSNIVWSQKGNFLEIPTDCPQRDERLGWTGDAQVFIRTAAFNMNVATFFAKWLQIMADDQGTGSEAEGSANDDGKIPSVVPHCPTI
jgi:alpha-L-rhamnosidase